MGACICLSPTSNKKAQPPILQEVALLQYWWRACSLPAIHAPLPRTCVTHSFTESYVGQRAALRGPDGGSPFASHFPLGREIMDGGTSGQKAPSPTSGQDVRVVVPGAVDPGADSAPLVGPARGSPTTSRSWASRLRLVHQQLVGNRTSIFLISPISIGLSPPPVAVDPGGSTDRGRKAIGSSCSESPRGV